MVTSGKLTRYNPHNIEKQAAKWPVLFFRHNLFDDTAFRTMQLWNRAPQGWSEPVNDSDGIIRRDLAEEYGIDAIRMAMIAADKPQDIESLLESSFKWLANLFMALQSHSSSFSESVWLETAYQMHDHILCRANMRAGMAALKKACKNARPGSNIPHAAKNLVISCLYAFAPCLAGHLAGMPANFPLSFDKLSSSFNELVAVKLGFERGGWSWHVFDKNEFVSDAKAQIIGLRWVNASAKGRNFELKNEQEGIRICLSQTGG